MSQQNLHQFIPKIITEEEYPAAIAAIEEEFARTMIRGIHTTSQGIHLAYAYQLVEQPVGSVIILHGYTEFYQKYYELASYLLALGYNVFLYDQRGHGYSERETQDMTLAHIGRFDDYVDDLESIINELVKKIAPTAPLCFFSHSMGGAIALRYMQRHPSEISKAVLASPMIIPQTHHVPLFLVRRNAKRDVNKLGAASRFRYSGNFNPNPAYTKSHDTSFARFYHNLETRRGDSHYQGCTITNGWLLESVTIGQKLLSPKANAPITTKIALYSAGHDSMVRIKPHRKLAKQFSYCTYRFFPEARHSIYSAGNEGLQEFYQLLFTFLQPNEV